MTADTLDLPMQLKSGLLAHLATHHLAKTLDIFCSRVTSIDQKVGMFGRNLCNTGDARYLLQSRHQY